jgi:hypothetical protein
LRKNDNQNLKKVCEILKYFLKICESSVKFRVHPSQGNTRYVKKKKCRNIGMPEKKLVRIVSFTGSPLRKSGIGVPAPTSVRYRWSRTIPVVPSYAE